MSGSIAPPHSGEAKRSQHQVVQAIKGRRGCKYPFDGVESKYRSLARYPAVPPTRARALHFFHISTMSDRARACMHLSYSVAYQNTEILMSIGTVKWFNETKGFGFIQPDNGGPDAFVAISAVERAGLRDLVEDQKVSYEME